MTYDITPSSSDLDMSASVTTFTMANSLSFSELPSEGNILTMNSSRMLFYSVLALDTLTGLPSRKATIMAFLKPAFLTVFRFESTSL